MPVYEYRCENDHAFETEQKIQEDPLQECPRCRAPCRRQLFPVSFQLSGTGWSKDGYSGSASKKKNH